MQEAVLKIKAIGPPPEGFENDVFPGDEGFPPEETLNLWEEYQDAVDSITRPVTWEEAEILIKCCPTDYMAGIEWSLLHCIESCVPNEVLLEKPEELEKYRNLICQCNSDMMKELLLKRLEGFLSNHS